MSQFPVDQFEWGYALSDEPVLLNGMKVLFDKSASVYPVNLEPKNGVAFNSSMAKSLRNNRDFASGLSTYSMAQSLDWDDAKKLKIYASLTRLNDLVENPYLVNQANEGNCGFAAVLMAMLYLAGANKLDADAKAAKQEVLKDLLNAIYHENKYKKMNATQSRNANPSQGEIETKHIPPQIRYLVDKGEVKNRIERRLEHYDNNPGDITCYVLLIGLLIFFKDHVQDIEPKLWEEIMKFQMVFATGGLKKGLTDQNDQWTKNPGNKVNKIKNMPDGGKLDRGYKKGDLALTKDALLELCKQVNINTVHYFHEMRRIGSDENLTTDEEKYKLSKINKTSQSEGNDLIFKSDSNPTKSWNSFKFPCIVGLYTYENKDDQGNPITPQLKANYSAYNFLKHWIFMPAKNEVWTWGKKYVLSSIDPPWIPVEVIEVSLKP